MADSLNILKIMIADKFLWWYNEFTYFSTTPKEVSVMKKKGISLLLVLSLLCSILCISPQFSFAKSKSKVTVSKKNIKVKVDGRASFKIKGVKEKNVSLVVYKRGNNNISVVRNKLNFTVSGHFRGSSDIQITLQLRKKVGGKKIYKFTVYVDITDDKPSTSDGFDEALAKQNLKVERYAMSDRNIVYKFTNNYSLPIIYDVKMSFYKDDLVMHTSSLGAYAGDKLCVPPGQVRYAEAHMDPGYLGKYTLKDEVVVKPAVEGEGYRVPDEDEYSITYGKVGDEYVFNAESKVPAFELRYNYYILVYRDGQLYNVEYAAGGGYYNQVGVLRKQIYIPESDSKGHSITFEVVPNYISLYHW